MCRADTRPDGAPRRSSRFRARRRRRSPDVAPSAGPWVAYARDWARVRARIAVRMIGSGPSVGLAGARRKVETTEAQGRVADLECGQAPVGGLHCDVALEPGLVGSAP